MQRKQLLVLDDEVEIANYIKDVAEMQHYDVHVISDSSDFMKIYDEVKPDTIIVDICMPEPDGIEIMRKLAKNKCAAQTLFISGSGDFYLSSILKLAKDFGLEDVSTMPKPLSLNKLRSFLLNRTPPIEYSEQKYAG